MELINIMKEFSNMIGEELSMWSVLVIAVMILYGIIRITHRTPEWIAKTTKDEDGNTVTQYFRMDR